MPRPKGGKPSTSGTFKKYFTEKPELLQVTSLDEVINRYKQEHPNVEVTPPLRQIAANIKSTMKRKMRLSANGSTKKKRGRPKGSTKAATHTGAVAAAPHTSNATLERLEDRIDECVALAKEIDRRGLIHVIRLLRRALNGVVVRIEEV